jgi:hypothetical protein
MTGGAKDIVRRKPECPIRPFAREGDALVHESRPHALSPNRWLDEQQPQVGDILGDFDTEHRADVYAVALGNPASLAVAIMVLDELRH